MPEDDGKGNGFLLMIKIISGRPRPTVSFIFLEAPITFLIFLPSGYTVEENPEPDGKNVPKALFQLSFSVFTPPQ